MSSLGKRKQKSSQKARNSAARLAAVQAVYQMFENRQKPQDVIEDFVERRLGMPVDEQEMVLPDGVLFKTIVSGIGNRYDDLETLVLSSGSTLPDDDEEQQKSGVSFSAYKEPLLRAILLCGAYELLAHHEIDAPIIIADYLNVSHAFYDQGEAKLVNAVLDNVKTAVRDDI